jgi:predicted dehydrogenase
LLDAGRPYFNHNITPPDRHAVIAGAAAARGVHILCQKALAPSYAEAEMMVATAAAAGVRFMAHDNFRFQPWHREIRRLMDAGAIGALEAIACRTRMGDGAAPDAYLARQPYFRAMPRFLVFETGVHFIDVYRYLGGEITGVFAKLRRLNPAITGEDSATLLFDFADGARGLWDGDRTHSPDAADPRYTFGQFWIEGREGTLRLRGDATITLQKMGGAEISHAYDHGVTGFASDSVHAALSHFVARLRDGGAFETEGHDYLRTLAVQEAVYRSAQTGQAVQLA